MIKDWSYYQDDLSEIISDSIDLDWTPNDAAKSVVRWLNENMPEGAVQSPREKDLESEVFRLRCVLLGIAETNHYRRYPKQHEDGGIRGQSGLRAVRALTGKHGSYINDDEVRGLNAEALRSLGMDAAQ